MLSRLRLYETQSGRAREFFDLVRYTLLVIGGPMLVLHRGCLENNAEQQVVFVGIAIYADASFEALRRFMDTIRLCHLWRTRKEPRRHTRQVRVFDLPNFVVPIQKTTDGFQRIRRRDYVRVIVLAVVIVSAVTFPAIIIHFNAVQRGEESLASKNSSTEEDSSVALSRYTIAEGVILAVFMWLGISIATRGNVVAGAFFLVENLFNERLLNIRDPQVTVITASLYITCVVFGMVALGCRIWVYSSPNPGLRALATVYLFKATIDLVATTENRFGRIDEGDIYANLREKRGMVRPTVDTEATTQEVLLEEGLNIV